MSLTFEKQDGNMAKLTIERTAEELNQFCADCDFVVHAAGVNRPKETSEFMEGNFGFTSTLLDTLKKHKNKSPIRSIT